MLERELYRSVARSQTLRQVALMALAAGAYAGLAVWKESTRLGDMIEITPELHTALSLVLGLLLVFRTNAAYARWWEARTLWGALVNASRNLAAKVVTLGNVPRDEAARAGDLIAAFPHALRRHLRRQPHESLPEGVSVTPDGHGPAQITKRLYAMVGSWKSVGWIDGDELRVLDRELAKQLDICGGCERILNTPIARSYRSFARQCIWLFLLSLPWGVVDTFHAWTIPLVAIVAYFMIGLEIVAEHVEEPFGHDEDDLDLDGLCATIERTVGEMVADPAQG